MPSRVIPLSEPASTFQSITRGVAAGSIVIATFSSLLARMSSPLKESEFPLNMNDTFCQCSGLLDLPSSSQLTTCQVPCSRVSSFFTGSLGVATDATDTIAAQIRSCRFIEDLSRLEEGLLLLSFRRVA